jgi:D-glycero-alpha-D-manno-heptose-7-phosphate kinase
MKQIVVSRSPLRISFSGGGSDFPRYFENSEGLVISSAINRFVNVTTTFHSLAFSEAFRIHYSEIELTNSVDEIKNSVIRECIKYCNEHWGKVERITISTSSDIPSGSGLGSSSALTCALLINLARHFNISLSALELAEIACQIEVEKIGKPIGFQDQYASAFGGINAISFSKNGIEVRKKNLSDYARELDGYLVLISTGIFRSADEVLKHQHNPSAEQISILDKMVEATKNLENKLESNMKNMKIAAISENLRLQNQLKAEISPYIYSEEVKSIVGKIQDLNLAAMKISGAGGGGFVLGILNNKIISKPEKAEYFSDSKLLVELINLHNKGTEIIYEY